MDNPTQLTNEEFQTMLKDAVDKGIRDAGLDKVDRKHGMFGASDDPNGEGLENLTKEQRITKFLTATVAGDMATVKALSEGVTTDGGYLVPTEFRAVILEKLYKTAVIRPSATTLPMSRDKMQVPSEGNTVTTYWEGENVTFQESNPTFGQTILDVNKLTGLSKMSRELFADTPISLIDFVASRYAIAFAQEEDKQFMTGDGTLHPKGIRQYSLTSIPQAGAHLGADDLITLFYAVPVQYRKFTSWILHNDIIKAVRLLKDNYGRYLWTDGLNVAPDTIMGRPVLEQNDIPINLGGGTNASEIYLGNVAEYLIGDREQMGVETTTVGAGTFENHQVAFKCWERVDGQLGLIDSFRKLTGVIQ